MNVSYLPVSDADRVVWLNTFSARLGQYRTALGLSQTELDGVLNDASMFAYCVQALDASRQHTLALSNLKKQLRSAPQQSPMPSMPTMPIVGNPPSTINSGIFNRIVLMVNQIRQHAAYTPTMGNDLGIVNTVVPFNPATLTPDLSIRLQSGYPFLKWKKGETDGVNIYVDRHDNAGFVFLHHAFRNSYLDSQPLAPNTFSATWDYKVRYLIGDDEVGQFSPVISINVLRAS